MLAISEPEKRYNPAECTGVRKRRVEGMNLSIHMQNRRFTRLTNGFSKKLDYHIHALALYFAFYNFCRIHKSLKMTPAMAAGSQNSCGRLRILLPRWTKWLRLQRSAVLTRKGKVMDIFALVLAGGALGLLWNISRRLDEIAKTIRDRQISN